MTQTRLAESIGTTQDVISKIERGSLALKASRLLAIASVLDMDLGELTRACGGHANGA